MKPKQNYKPSEKDNCQTPHYAIDPLLPYLESTWRIWESAAGEGNIVSKLSQSGFDVVGTDILTGQDYFSYEPVAWDCQVTNPPYNQYVKYRWLERAYALGKPFALLLNVDTLGPEQAQIPFEKYGIEIILLNKRVNFKMPNKGYAGDAQFSSAWFTWGLGIGETLTFGKITRYADSQAFLLSLGHRAPAIVQDPRQMSFGM